MLVDSLRPRATAGCTHSVTVEGTGSAVGILDHLKVDRVAEPPGGMLGEQAADSLDGSADVAVAAREERTGSVEEPELYAAVVEFAVLEEHIRSVGELELYMAVIDTVGPVG